jgi:hypothetical protein
MKTASLVLLLAGVCSTASVGCIGFGCDAPNNGYRAPLNLAPASTLAFRTPATCGISPAYGPGDVFSLELSGDTNITVDVGPSAPIGEQVPLVVASDATAGSQAGGIKFSMTSGASLDPTALDSVVVTVTSLPTADGQPLAAELRLVFDDGRELDQTFTANVQSTWVSCVAHRAL